MFRPGAPHMIRDRSRNDVEGIVFPILPNHLERFSKGQKTVFVKFVGRGSLPETIQRGSRLFFYESRSK